MRRRVYLYPSSTSRTLNCSFYQSIEENDSRLHDALQLQKYDDNRDLSSYDFEGDGLENSKGDALKCALRYRRIRDMYLR